MGKDRFSDQAKHYANFRPTYPQDWYNWLLQQVPSRAIAWDVGTGNGQVARILAQQFDHVWATDLSQKQLDQAPTLPNIEYRQALAHEFPGSDHSCDLITVAQALHWFDLDQFYPTVAKALSPNGILAVWGYGLPHLMDPPLQHAFIHWYKNVLGPHWDAERKHVEDHYQNLPFPYPLILGPNFSLAYTWTLEQWFGYLQSWSGVRNFIKSSGEDPIDQLRGLFPKSPNTAITVSFPIFYHVGKAQ